AGSSTPGSTPPPAAGQPAAGSSGGARGGAQPRLTINSLNLNQRRTGQPQRIGSLFDLINSSVDVPSGAQGGTTAAVAFSPDGRQMAVAQTTQTQQTTTNYPSPLNDPGTLRQMLPLLLDKVTTTRDTELPGRINVNTAPLTVLRTLPGVEDADAQNILAARPSPGTVDPTDPLYQTPAWMVTDANISPQTMKALERYITA